MPDPGTGFPSVPDQQPDRQDPPAPDTPTPSISGYLGSVGSAIGGYLKDVVTGKVAERGLEAIQPPPYDPSKSLAAMATDPQGLSNAANIALGFSGGGLSTADLRMPTPKPIPKVNVISKEAPPFPQLAERYPATGEPKWKPKDRDPTQMYPEKVKTQQEVQLQKARNTFQTQMNREGYNPYYPLGQRFYVDPTNYPDVAFDTATVLPEKQATIDKHLSYVGATETRNRLRQAYRMGSMMPGAEHWYAMGQLERDFIDILGPEEGRRAFQDHFAGAMAAVTSGQAPTANMLMSHYLGYLEQTGQPFPTGGFEIPHPIGGQYIMDNVDEYLKTYGPGGPRRFGAKEPKKADFQQSLLGQRKSYTWDKQMTSGATPGYDRPVWYGVNERVGREEADAADVDPAEHQNLGWAGFKRQRDPTYQPEPMMAHVNHAIERTHRVTGMDRDEIVHRGLVKREIPLYGLGMLSWLGYRGLDQGDQQ